MIILRRLGLFLFALGLLTAACSSDDSSDEATDSGEEAAATTEAPADEIVESEEDGEQDSEDNSGDSGDASTVDLGEWFVDTPASIAAGPRTFAVSNSGENPHAFAIARGTSYEELPQLDNGAVDTDALGADFLGTTENLMTGEGAEIEFDLEAGDYVFFCPVQFGPNSHAAAGQVLSVSVG